MSRTEAATRRAGAFVVLAAASALVRQLPAAHHAVVLALHVVLLLGCAAVQLAPAHRAVAGHARRVGEAARMVLALGDSARAAACLRWVGFAGILLIYALYVEKVQGFLVFLAAVWAVLLSMVTGRPAAAAEEEEDELDGGEVNAMDASIC